MWNNNLRRITINLAFNSVSSLLSYVDFYTKWNRTMNTKKLRCSAYHHMNRMKSHDGRAIITVTWRLSLVLLWIRYSHGRRDNWDTSSWQDAVLNHDEIWAKHCSNEMYRKSYSLTDYMINRMTNNIPSTPLMRYQDTWINMDEATTGRLQLWKSWKSTEFCKSCLIYRYFYYRICGCTCWWIDA